jgi:hypothetical protein
MTESPLSETELTVLGTGLPSMPYPALRRRAVAEIRRLRKLLADIHRSRAIGVAIDYAANDGTVGYLEALNEAAGECGGGR